MGGGSAPSSPSLSVEYGFVDIRSMAFWFDQQFHLTSANAILTWIKLFVSATVHAVECRS